jgi:hypothetical protein
MYADRRQRAVAEAVRTRQADPGGRGPLFQTALARRQKAPGLYSEMSRLFGTLWHKF